ncbi:LOB domain-containing protein 36-like [Impatiens glandulifera]|uniref:LOB domain-containing protein 36-like n=1 Tax=Impatiens glandulifera TaxID=253017 RepID=UPI001FB13AB7|nr:LOB domain-containing protein 36-like [Impatiens glandulifera]XP_047336175.1 LOB domain-containing protein 36-like [Impatiens glandulifera]
MSSALTNSPCAACKLLRRKCTQECVFAPYFPPDNPQKFANVHRVFGASNVSKLLKELSPNQREDAVNSLAYEAEFRLRDPVYGCVGLISILQHRLRQVQTDLENAKKEIASYIGPSAMLPILNNFSSNSVLGYNNNNNTNVTPILGIPTQLGHLMIRDNHNQMIDAHQMLRSYNNEQHPNEHQIVRFSNGGFDLVGFNQMEANNVSSSEESFQIQTPLTAQLLVQQPQPEEQQQQSVPLQERSGNEGRIVGLSC